jgi:integrase
VVLVAAFAGLRFAEIAGLQRRHVDLLRRIIVVEQQLEVVSKATAEHLGIGRVGFGPPKSEAGYRTLSIPKPLALELEHHLATHSASGSDGLVFVGPLGAPLHRANFGPKFAAARRAAGLPDGFRFHDLRHTHMTAAAESGASTKELMRRLGQSSPSAALRYQHATDNRDVAIADAVADRLARPRPEPRDGRAMEPKSGDGSQNAKAPGTHTAQGFRAESG